MAGISTDPNPKKALPRSYSPSVASSTTSPSTSTRVRPLWMRRNSWAPLTCGTTVQVARSENASADTPGAGAPKAITSISPRSTEATTSPSRSCPL